MFGTNSLSDLLASLAGVETRPMTPGDIRPAEMLNRIIDIGGSVFGRSEDTAEGRQVTIGDPGTSDLADEVTGASGLMQLLQGEPTLTNLVDAAGVGLDLGIPGPSLSPLMSLLFPMGRAKNLIGETIGAAEPFFRRTAQENVIESLAEVAELPRGTLLDHTGPIFGMKEEGFSLRDALNSIASQRDAMARGDAVLPPGELPVEDQLNELLTDTLDSLTKVGVEAPRVTSLGQQGREIGSASVNMPSPTDGKLGNFFPDVDKPGNAMINIATQVDPDTLRLRHLAEHPMHTRDMGRLVEHETQHLVNKFVPSNVFEELVKDTDTMQFFENIMIGKYGELGNQHYGSLGLSDWLDEALAVAIDTGTQSMIPHQQLATELTELKEAYGPLQRLQRERRAAGLIGR
jgi:hypothetical protein